MRKIRFIGLFVILIVTYTLFALGEDDYGSLSSTKDQINWLNNNLGIQVSGTGFNYEQSSKTLTLSSGTSATLAKPFSGTITLSGGTVELTNNARLSGEGSYTQNGGFSITNGNLNGVEIANANGVTYNGNQISGTTNSDCTSNCKVGGREMSSNTEFTYDLSKNTLTGTTSKTCSPCTFNGQEIGTNTKYVYDFNKNQIIFAGKLGTTTLPKANIVFEDGNYKLGDMTLNLKDSEIYLAKGGRMTIDGIPLAAVNRHVKLSFIESADGHKLIPFRNFIVSSTDKSVSDVFNEAGYQGSENFNKRREIYESKYPDEKYTGAGAQNIKFLDALKSGDAVLFYNDQASNVRIIFRLTDSTPISTPNGPTAKEIFQKANSPDYVVPPSIARYAGQPDIKAVLGSINDDMLRHIIEQSNKNNLPPIIPIIIGSVESRFNDGVGCKGVGEQSCGIMQIKPSTAVSLGFNAQDTLNPHKSIEIATRYLGQFNQRYIDIPMPERSLHIMAAYKQGAYGYETKGISQSTKDYLLKGDQFQKGLEPQINTRISKLK